MIIFLYGKDSYRRNRKLRELCDAYREKYAPLDMAVFDLEDNPDDWQKAADFLNQPSMFVDSKLAVIKAAQAVDAKEWISVLKNQIEIEKVFVVISEEIPPKKDFKFLTKEGVTSQQFGELEEAVLAAFLKKEITLRGLRFSEDASRYFLSYVADSAERSALAVNELDKLRLLSAGEEISLTRLRTIVRYRRKDEVFRIASAVLREREAGRRLGALERAFLQREAPSYVFNSLGFQAKGKSALRLADYDISIKSGGLEYEEALTDFVLA